MCHLLYTSIIYVYTHRKVLKEKVYRLVSIDSQDKFIYIVNYDSLKKVVIWSSSKILILA